MNISQTYTQNDLSGMNQVDLESRALIRAAAQLNSIKEHWDEEKENLSEVLEKNRLLWTVIASAVSEDTCQQPLEVRNNIANLAVFIFKRTMALLLEPKPEGLDILININVNIAKGLALHEESQK